jgi:hypothetical protein
MSSWEGRFEFFEEFSLAFIIVVACNVRRNNRKVKLEIKDYRYLGEERRNSTPDCITGKIWVMDKERSALKTNQQCHQMTVGSLLIYGAQFIQKIKIVD